MSKTHECLEAKFIMGGILTKAGVVVALRTQRTRTIATHLDLFQDIRSREETGKICTVSHTEEKLHVLKMAVISILQL